MLWAPALLLAFLAPASQTASNLEWSGRTVIKRTGELATITCDVAQESIDYVHWYRFQEGMVPKRILYYSLYYSNSYVDRGFTAGKYDVSKVSSKSFKLEVRNLEESDSGVYSCAAWASSGVIKIFGQGTKLTVIPSGGHRSPKPTMFLPSIAETHFHKAGTYLCLLEDFVPDVIKVYWKAKDGNTILESHQGNTVKTKDAYMKVSWLTVKGKSMDEEHKCVVRHENNKGGVDQEILFPSINKGVIPTVPTEATYLLTTGNTPSPPPECSSAELNADELQLQYMNTSAYYTYLLLLLKSSVYLVVIMICLGRRGVCGHGKSS